MEKKRTLTAISSKTSQQTTEWETRGSHTIGVRFHPDDVKQLVHESEALGKTVSEHVRAIVSAHLWESEAQAVTLQKLSIMHSLIRELGIDIETVTRMLLVGLKITTDEDAKNWCRENLMVGK